MSIFSSSWLMFPNSSCRFFSGSLTEALQSLFVQIGDRASHESFKPSVGEKLSHHHLEPTSVEELHDEVLHAPIVDPLLDGLLDQGTCCPVHQVPSSFTIATSKKSTKSTKFTSKLSSSCMVKSRQLLQLLLVLVFLVAGKGATCRKDAKVLQKSHLAISSESGEYEEDGEG